LQRLRLAALAGLLLATTACAGLPNLLSPDGRRAERLMADVRVLAADDMQGRLVGTEGSARARRYIIRRFAELGLQPGAAGGWTQGFAFAEEGAEFAGTNVIGVARGRSRPDDYIVVTAHYDHMGVVDGEVMNGADDNASGVAALFELARQLRRRRPEHSVLFVALDAEEQGLKGAEAFVRSPPVPLDRLRLNINLDMISRSDSGEFWAVGTTQYPRLRPPLEQVARRAPVKLRFGRDRPEDKGRDNWVDLSDQAAFHAAGVPFVYFSIDDHPDYHRPTDDPERMHVRFYQGAVATVLDALRTFDRMDLRTLKDR